MRTKIAITAKDKLTALNKALQFFSQETKREIKEAEIKLVGLQKKAGFLGIGKKNNYHFELILSETEAEERLSHLDETITTPNIDGYFQLKVKQDGIFLKVFPPQGTGKPANLLHIKQIVEHKELVDIDLGLVETILTEGKAEDVKIAERKPELDREGSFLVDIAPHGMKAYCTYLPPLGKNAPSLRQAIQILNKSNLFYGIDEEKLQAIIDENVKQEREIAIGKPPIDGKPGELRYHFQLPSEQKHVKELEDGTVDYHNLDLIVNVRRGDLLITKIPPTIGETGIDVTGKEIQPKPGKDIKLPKGKNVEIGPDGMSLFAAIDGQVFLTGNKVSVLPVYIVDGDVDLETGNIQFLGNVVIKGNVQEGFSIKADGDIEIMGNVGAANLEAGGKIIVRKGFQGKQKGMIKATSDVHINFIENGHVITRGSLFVNGAIMHSTIVAKINVVVEGRGLIVGGTVQAGNDVTAKTIGSHLATPTEIMAGCDPEIRQQLEQMNIEIENATENLDKVVKGIELLRKAENQLGSLPKDKYAVLNQFGSTRSYLEEQMNSLVQQRDFLSKQLKEQKNGRIKVLDRVHPGVRINIGQAGYRVKDAVARTAFVYEDGEVRIRTL